ncbi:MAG: hypothetical protein V1861_06845 [Candidatus Micrarchaeota archaeon]
MAEYVNYGATVGRKMCVSCQLDVEGKKAFPIAEDRVIRILRAVKKALRIAQMNKLFVCEACMPKHMERRRSFEKTMLFASVLAGIMLLIMIIAPILSGRFEALAFVSGFIVAGFIVLLPVMFKYVPAVEGVSTLAKQASGGSARPVPPGPYYPPAPMQTAQAEPPKQKSQAGTAAKAPLQGAKGETARKKKTKKK